MSDCTGDRQQELLDRIADLEASLRFYADHASWDVSLQEDWGWDGEDEYRFSIEVMKAKDDGGYLARATLGGCGKEDCRSCQMSFAEKE